MGLERKINILFFFLVMINVLSCVWVIAENTTGTAISPEEANSWQDQFENEIIEKGWLHR